MSNSTVRPPAGVYLESVGDPMPPGTRAEGYMRPPAVTKMSVILSEVEVTPSNTPPWWAISWFKFCLWASCLLAGRLKLYPVLLAQAKFETGDFTSYGFQKRFNAFGMRPSQPNQAAPNATRLRKQWWTSESNGFAVYPGYWASCQDRLAWDDMNKIKPGTHSGWQNAYVKDVLSDGYVPPAERENYQTQWLKLIEQSGDGPSVFAVLVTIGVTAAVLYTLWKILKPKATRRPRRWWTRRKSRGGMK